MMFEAHQLHEGLLLGESVGNIARAAAAKDDLLAAHRGHAADGGLQVALHLLPIYIRPGDRYLRGYEDIEDRRGQRRAVERSPDRLEIRVQR